MSHQDNIIDSKKKETWDEEYKQKGFKVQPESALNYELEKYFPSYVFIKKEHLVTTEAAEAENQNQLKISHLTFLMHDNKPMEKTSDGGIRWFEIEPMNMSLVLHRIQDLLPVETTCSGAEGFLVPLQESDTFERIEDANAYVHNLMFWESIISPNECGPLFQRLSWLSQKLYAMRGEQRDVMLYLRKKGVSDLNVDSVSAMDLLKAAESLKSEDEESKPASRIVLAPKLRRIKNIRIRPHYAVSCSSYNQDLKHLLQSVVSERQSEILQNIDLLRMQTDKLEEQSKILADYYDSIIKNIGNRHGVVRGRSAKGRF